MSKYIQTFSLYLLLGIVIIIIITAEVYFHGIQFIWREVGTVIGCIVCSVVFVPTFYKLRLVSAYEVSDTYFSRITCRNIKILNLFNLFNNFNGFQFNFSISIQDLVLTGQVAY